MAVPPERTGRRVPSSGAERNDFGPAHECAPESSTVIGEISPILLLAALAATSVTQDSPTHRHPALPVSIEAPADWIAGAWRDDPGVLELSAPNGSAQVLLWFTDTEQSADRYPAKMVGMKPVEPTGHVGNTEIGGPPAWRVVMDVGPCFPGEGTLGLQAWSPEKLRAEYGALIEMIVGRLRVDPESS